LSRRRGDLCDRQGFRKGQLCDPRREGLYRPILRFVMSVRPAAVLAAVVLVASPA
jgi:hypothetical protein